MECVLTVAVAAVPCSLHGYMPPSQVVVLSFKARVALEVEGAVHPSPGAPSAPLPPPLLLCHNENGSHSVGPFLACKHCPFTAPPAPSLIQAQSSLALRTTTAPMPWQCRQSTSPVSQTVLWVAMGTRGSWRSAKRGRPTGLTSSLMQRPQPQQTTVRQGSCQVH